MSFLKEHLRSATSASSKRLSKGGLPSATHQIRMAGKIRGVLVRLKSLLGAGMGLRRHLDQIDAPSEYDTALAACKSGSVTAECIDACRAILQLHVDN